MYCISYKVLLNKIKNSLNYRYLYYFICYKERLIDILTASFINCHKVILY